MNQKRRPDGGAPGLGARSIQATDQPSEAEIGTPLIPGQKRYPINLPCALGLAGARSIDIAIAQERIRRAVADWERVRVAFLPTFTAGPNYIRHDGRAQMVNGPVFTVSKSSLFLGGSAVAGDGFPGPRPAGEPAPTNALALVFNFSDAIFQPLAARQVIRARRAEADATAHDILLNVSEVYFNLLSAQGQRAIAREAYGNARDLARVLESYVRSGLGLEADYRRVLTEVNARRRDAEFWEGQFEVASAELVRLLRLDPTIVLDPVEPPGILVSWLDDGKPLGDLIALGLRNRPELAADQALVEAARDQVRAARLHPLLPGAVVRYSGGSFGGGSDSFVGNFGGRSDLEAGMFWELRNLGLGDLAQVHAMRSEHRSATLSLARQEDLVAAEITQADKQVLSARRQVEAAGSTIDQAVQSLKLNFQNIRKAAGLPQAVIPLNVLQPIQALAQARSNYLQSVMDYNRAQFRLYRSVGYPPLLSAP